MSSKTPSSLLWLINKRSRLAGDLIALKDEFRKATLKQQEAQAEIKRITRLLASVDETMKLHEIKIEPTKLRTVRSAMKSVFEFGELTAEVLAHLRKHPERWFSTSELVDVVCVATGVDKDMYDAEYLRRLLRRRLRALAAKKILVRPTKREGCDEQLWRLARTFKSSARSPT